MNMATPDDGMAEESSVEARRSRRAMPAGCSEAKVIQKVVELSIEGWGMHVGRLTKDLADELKAVEAEVIRIGAELSTEARTSGWSAAACRSVALCPSGTAACRAGMRHSLGICAARGS